MGTVVFEMVILFVLALGNGIFALAEIAVVSSRKPLLEQRAGEGDRRARAALALARAPERFLATVQVGITLIGILAGAYGGATLARELAATLRGLGLSEGLAADVGLGAVVLVVGWLQIVIGELVPKSLALSRPERFAGAVAGPMSLLARAAAPLVSLFAGSARLVQRLLRIRPPAESAVTGEEIAVMVAHGARSGVLAQTQREMVEGVMETAWRRVGSLMTPRNDVVWLEAEDPAGRTAERVGAGRHTRLPLCRGGLDRVIGIVRVVDLLADCVAGKPLDLEGHAARPLYVAETLPVLRAIERFRERHTDVALVLDEYGAVAGLLTLNDALEAIAGDVTSAPQPPSPAAFRRADGSWLVDGLLSIDDLAAEVGAPARPRESAPYQTVGGLAMSVLGRVPATGDRFVAEGYEFEILDMDGNRVDKLLVRATSGT